MRIFKSLVIVTGLLAFSPAQASTAIDACKSLFDSAEYDKALTPCLEAAETGHLDSQSILGELYNNLGNSKETYYWWNRAAGAGYLPARNQLAMKFYYGGSVFGPEEGWKKNYPRAYSIWKKDALNGNAASQFMVAEMHFKGQGVTRDLPEAWAWFRLSLDKGYQLASDSLHEVKNNMSREQMLEARKRYDKYREREVKR